MHAYFSPNSCVGLLNYKYRDMIVHNQQTESNGFQRTWTDRNCHIVNLAHYEVVEEYCIWVSLSVCLFVITLLNLKIITIRIVIRTFWLSVLVAKLLVVDIHGFQHRDQIDELDCFVTYAIDHDELRQQMVRAWQYSAMFPLSLNLSIRCNYFRQKFNCGLNYCPLVLLIR